MIFLYKNTGQWQLNMTVKLKYLFFKFMITV
nr:MAG TPA: hypothetical protein [Caudoviricetes sp.]